MFGKEPAVLSNGISEILRALLPVAILFGWIHWTDQQIAAVMLFGGVVLGFCTTLLTRSQTVSTSTADKQIEIAKASSVDTPTSLIIQQAKDSQ